MIPEKQVLSVMRPNSSPILSRHLDTPLNRILLEQEMPVHGVSGVSAVAGLDRSPNPHGAGWCPVPENFEP
jgi:hypothetical protein